MELMETMIVYIKAFMNAMQLEEGENLIESNIEKNAATLIGFYGTNCSPSNALNICNTISINVMMKIHCSHIIKKKYG